MSRFPPLFILRHGETEWNAQGRLQGRFDSELTAQGLAQAKSQHRILAQQQLAGFAAISSPQGRAYATAKIALSGLVSPIKTDPALSEIGLGQWAGKNRVEMVRESGARDGFALYELAPEGEGFDALHARCQKFLKELRHPSVVVTHGITSRMLRLILTDQPIGALRSIDGGQGVVFHLSEGKQRRLTLGA
ncbi:Phosphoglycerate mutase [Sulfitobacter noctilucicola]|uniref:Putative phosphoglycerate mutase n=1 Tax=Sulfitobacter noctilucicola TaxID=1342301 RepID=A0A7W6MCJ0_9RHOB|nr:histidine phosphatase family protein [Sulfitobacter noctilucicola]KIN66393.1 Phosphoglycerate mutase [Sulfitobacter noctilucicola]MBB4175742.1 putative phosphoglycerate mutase [Sulfitobacter noctilucicola]